MQEQTQKAHGLILFIVERNKMAFDEQFVNHIIDSYPQSLDLVAFDIGANKGKYTIPLAKKFQKVYAFEVCAETCDTLKKVLKDHGISNAEVVNMGVSDQDGEFPMFAQAPDPTDKGGNTLSKKVADRKTWGHRPERFRMVTCVTLDTFCKDRNINNLRFIKMDIEGGEDFAWKGAIETLDNNYLDIILEVHNCVDYQALHKFFMERKYNVYDTKAQAAMFNVDSHYLVTNRS